MENVLKILKRGKKDIVIIATAIYTQTKNYSAVTVNQDIIEILTKIA